MNKRVWVGVILISNMMVIAVLGIGMGIILDNTYDTAPLWTLVGLASVFVMWGLSFYQFWRVNQKYEKMNNSKNLKKDNASKDE